MPKKFGDLAKPVNDLFSDDFISGAEVELKTKSANGIELECKGSQGSKGVTGQLTTSLNWLGLGFKETWKTDNTVTSEITKKNFVDAKASKAVAELVISPTSGLTKVTAKANVETGDFHVDLKTSGADIPKSLDLGFVYSFLGNWSLGVKASSKDVLSPNPAITKTLAGLYTSDSNDLSIYSEVGLDDSSICGKVFHTPSSTSKFGAQICTKGNDTTLSAVSEYTLDELTSVKAAINSNMVLNVASTHQVGAATISPSAEINLGASASPSFGLGIKMKN